MNHFDLLREFSSTLQMQTRRAFRLDWGQSHRDLENSLILQRIDVTEALCSGIEGHLTCLSMDADLPLKSLIGLPLTLKIVTDRGGLHAISGIITGARAGKSDGSLTCYQLTLRDALSVLEGRINRRVFRQKSILDVIGVLLNEWRKKSTTFASTFDIDFSALTYSKYPVREMIRQHDESDAAFIQRLLRREGVSWFIAAGKLGSAPSDQNTDPMPIHTLVLFDDPMTLPQSAAGTVRYHRDAATETRDSITHWSARQQIVAGGVERSSWDYKTGRVDRKVVSGNIDQGDGGNDLGRLLVDGAIDTPHAANSLADYDRISMARMLAHEARAHKIDGVSGVRDLAVGRWFALTEHPQVDKLPAEQRQFIVTNLHHRGENNLPKELDERAQALFAANRWQFDDVVAGTRTSTSATNSESETRYENTFGCVTRGIPLTPVYDPRVDLPRVFTLTGIVVGPPGEPVYCDQMGRVRVQIQGLNPNDHAHANGAGTSGAHLDSAWVRVSGSWAGPNYGVNLPLRAGMEVNLDCMDGDPDKLFISGVMPGALNMPATFSNAGGLPGNRYVVGIKTDEAKGSGFNQLRLDDTSGQISAQLASTHAASELNLGYLTHPRTDGYGVGRGEGAELRSDANVAIRSGKAMLLSAWQRLGASDGQLARDEYLQLMQECVELFKSLGDYAAQNQGVAMDTQANSDLASAVQSWNDGEAPASVSATSSPQAVIGITAPGGISMATPKTVAAYAGGNIDHVAQNHVQLTGGQHVNVNAGHGIGLFAHQEDISAIANQGKVRLQSQSDDTLVDSAKNIKLTAAGGQLAGMASDQVVFMTSGGAYLKLHDGNIELGCPGSFSVKAANHSWSGAASVSTDMPKFKKSRLGRVPKLVRPTDGQPLSGYAGEVRQASGALIKGQSDSAGKMPSISSDQFQQLAMKFFKPNA